MLDKEEFIMAIKARECIWNVYSPMYNNKNARDRAWVEIFNLMAEDGRKYHLLNPEQQKEQLTYIQKKWKNMKDQYRRWKLQSDTKGCRRHLYSDLLNFLNPLIKDKRFEIREPIGAESRCESQIPNRSNLSDNNKRPAINHTEQVTSNGEINEEILDMNPPSKKQKTNDQNETERDLLRKLLIERLSRSDDQDPDLLFWKHLLPDIKKLPTSRKRSLFMTIMSIVDNYSRRLMEISNTDQNYTTYNHFPQNHMANPHFVEHPHLPPTVNSFIPPYCPPDPLSVDRSEEELKLIPETVTIKEDIISDTDDNYDS